MADQGIEAGPDQILLTDSGTHALDLVCRFLLQPGDTVLVDDPCYFNFLALLRAHRARVVGVPMTSTGPDVAVFAEAAATHRPRFYLTNSGVHNPTGASLAAATAHRLLKIAEAQDMVVVEDDIFADFEHTPSPRLAASTARPDDPYRQLLQVAVGGGALWPYRGTTRLDRRTGRPAHRDVDGGQPAGRQPAARGADRWQLSASRRRRSYPAGPSHNQCR